MSSHDKNTRSIYQRQHERISGNKDAFSRISGMYKENALGKTTDWFKGKRAVDIGCGNIGAMMIRLLELGVIKCTGVDIDSDWIKPLSENIERTGFHEGEFELKTGSVANVPYEDESFDFVSVNGALIHLENMDEIEKGFMAVSYTHLTLPTKRIV